MNSSLSSLGSFGSPFLGPNYCTYGKGEEITQIQGIELHNFGPVAGGTIHNKKINILFGPNNSGKSMTARLIYAATRTRPRGFTRSLELGLEEDIIGYLLRSGRDLRSPKDISPGDMYGFGVFRIVADSLRHVITHGQKECRIEINTERGPFSITLSASGVMTIDKGQEILAHEAGEPGETYRKQQLRQSVYIPAARTGTMQSFTTLMYVRNRLLRDIIVSFGGSLQREKLSAPQIRRFLRSLGRLPLYLEDFYDLILQSMSGGISDDLQRAFQVLHGGTLRLQKTEGLSSFHFVDSSGFSSDIEWAGSGVVSSFPILLGLYEVAEGGTLILEEPEVHLEPSRQMALLEQLCNIAVKKRIRLVVTTHSEYLLRKVLNMVTKEQLHNDDVGLYYFDRPKGQFSSIREIAISKTGEAEQPIFQQATESLIREYSEALLS